MSIKFKGIRLNGRKLEWIIKDFVISLLLTYLLCKCLNWSGYGLWGKCYSVVIFIACFFTGLYLLDQIIHEFVREIIRKNKKDSSKDSGIDCIKIK